METVRALFTEKEKELAIAVAKVDSLLRQLQDLKDSQQLTRSDRLRWHRQLPLAAELENLHNDLQVKLFEYIYVSPIFIALSIIL